MKIIKNNKLIIIAILMLLITGCTKKDNEVKASDDANGPKNAKEVLEKSVEFYKGQDIKSLSMDATGEIKVNDDSKYTLGVNIICGHIFKDKTFELEQGKMVLTTTFNNKSHSVTLHCFDDGSMGYALNKGSVYDVSDVSGMLGIKKVIPACTNIISDDETGEQELTENTEDVSGTVEGEDVNNLQETTVEKSDIYTVDDLLKMADRLVLKGYKDIDGKEVYVMKGRHSNNAIINSINDMIESNIYNLPTQYGDINYEIYADSRTFEIVGMEIDLGNVIKTLSQSDKEVENVIKVKFELNTLTQLPQVEVRKAGLDNISDIWTFMQYYTKVINGLKK